MLAQINTCGLMGMDGFRVCVQADISNGLSQFDIIGLPDAAVKESRERIKAAVKNSGRAFPMKKVTVNLAPASRRKEGAAYDLPVALAVLVYRRAGARWQRKRSARSAGDGDSRTRYGV